MSVPSAPKTAIITGAGSGIGRAVALGFIDAGYQVALLGRRLAPLQETLSFRPAYSSHLALVADVRDEAAVEEAFDTAVKSFGHLGVLFNNAGCFTKAAAIEDLPLDDWRTVIDTNLTGMFLCARAAFRRMKQGGGGRIINNGSISAHVPRPHSVAYTCSKHAVTGLTKTLSLEGRAHRIACGQIDIGNAATAMTAGFTADLLQADGSRRGEPLMDVARVVESVLLMANMPLDANVQFLTVMAATMPYIGRG